MCLLELAVWEGCHGRRSCQIVQVLNERFSEALRHKLSRPQLAADDAAFISIDRLGTDVRVRHGNEYSVERLSFDTVRAALAAHCMPPDRFLLSSAGPAQHVHTLEEALTATDSLLQSDSLRLRKR